MASRSRQPAETAKEWVLTPVLTLESHTRSVPSISYFPDGKRMISGSLDGTARRWDLEAGKEIEKAQHVCEQEVHAVAVSRDGRWVVMGGVYGALRVCEVETGIVRTFQGHPERINCIDISADSTLLASGGDLTTRIWRLDTGKLVAGLFKSTAAVTADPFENTDIVGAVRFSQDLKKIAVISNMGRCVDVWDVQTQKLDVRLGKYSFPIHPSPVFWTTEDKTIVAALSFTIGNFGNTIYEFDASTLKTVRTPFKGHTNAINGLALSFDCALLASASDDNTIKLWAFDSRQLLASFHVQNPDIIIFSPGSRQLAYTAWDDTNIYLCNTPPEILASIQPAQQVPRLRSHSRTYVPINTPLAHLHNSDAARRRNPTIDWAGAQTPGQPHHQTGRPPSRGVGWTESSTIRHAGTSCIQPVDMRPPTDMQRQHYDSGLQSLPQDLLYAHGGPAPDLPNPPTLPVIVVPPPSQRPSPVSSSQLTAYPRGLLPSSSHTDTVLPVRNHESGLPDPEAVLPNLTRYIIKDEDHPTARGGFGEIWKCTYSIDRTLIKVAVKALQVYAADYLGAAKTKKNERIKRELRICANLNHKNILPVYGYTYGFGPFMAIVSPWAENGNLTAYLEREGAELTLVRRFQILRDIIVGLQYLHANDVIHGDFNGSNVLIYGDGTACVADFGLSLMYSEVISASQASWTSTLKGNMRWIAPELLVDREDGSQVRPSEQSDMYSFGGIMLQVLTNKIPYYYLSNDAAIVLCIAKSQTPSRSRYPVLPETCWQFIEKCWSTDPQDRPSTKGADGVIRKEYYALSTLELFPVQSPVTLQRNGQHDA